MDFNAGRAAMQPFGEVLTSLPAGVSNRNPLRLVEAHLVASAIVKLPGAGRLSVESHDAAVADWNAAIDETASKRRSDIFANVERGRLLGSRAQNSITSLINFEAWSPMERNHATSVAIS
jgi:hypothetical protein